MCRFASTLVAFVVFSSSGVALGGLPEDHPEWFGYTAPLGLEAPIRWPAVYERAWMAPVVGDPYHATVLAALRPGAELTILARGAQNQLDLYTWMEGLALEPSQHQWVDVETLDTSLAGEWGPVALGVGDAEAFLLDGRYYSLRPADDAAAGRFAEDRGAPLHRIPLFLSRTHIQGTTDGLCLVAPEIYNMNIGHNAAEIDHALRVYAGCTTIVAVPAPSDEFKKKPMDISLRLTGVEASSGDGGAWGVLLGDSSAWSLSLQAGQEEVRAVLEAAGGAGLMTVIDMPWPETLDGTVRTYLPFVALDGAVVVPTYMGVPTIEEAMIGILLQELGAVDIRTVPSDLAATLEAWPSRLVGGGAGAPWADLPVAELLCESGEPLDCGQCMPECGEVLTFCVEDPAGPAVAGCVEGMDGCLDLLLAPCDEGLICEDGACTEPPTTCETLPAGGICEGNILVRCVAGQVIEVDCSQDFKLCAFEESGEAACFSPCTGGCQVPEETRCSDDGAGLLLTCTISPEGCPEWVESFCPALLSCEDGACVEVTADVVVGEIVEIGDVEGDAPSVNAGYHGKDGCRAGTGSAAGPGGILVILLAGLLAVGIRRPLYKAPPLP
ncbi:MAG: hypothetical protein ABIK09_00395 [Pseudomonadota bacterium]